MLSSDEFKEDEHDFETECLYKMKYICESELQCVFEF